MFYHFMFGPSYEAGCPVNSSMADGWTACCRTFMPAT